MISSSDLADLTLIQSVPFGSIDLILLTGENRTEDLAYLLAESNPEQVGSISLLSSINDMIAVFLTPWTGMPEFDLNLDEDNPHFANLRSLRYRLTTVMKHDDPMILAKHFLTYYNVIDVEVSTFVVYDVSPQEAEFLVENMSQYKIMVSSALDVQTLVDDLKAAQ